MATFDGSDLKAWRSGLKISAADLAERIRCDVTTIYRYESGKITPDPDVMYQICRELGDTRRWQDWMRTMFPTSYGREHPAPAGYDLPGSVLGFYGLLDAAMERRRSVSLDAADGHIDSQETRNELQYLCEEMISAAQAIKAKIREQEG